MIYQTFEVKDVYIETTIYDDSIAKPIESSLPKRLKILQPIFSSKGKANQILEFNSTGTLKATYGEDLEDLKKYGQGGINLVHTMSGGASAEVCRLLPDNAETAALLVRLQITEDDRLPVYKRTITGDFERDELGDKIPELDEDDKPKTIEGVKVKVIVEKGDPTTTADGKITSRTFERSADPEPADIVLSFANVYEDSDGGPSTQTVDYHIDDKNTWAGMTPVDIRNFMEQELGDRDACLIRTGYEFVGWTTAASDGKILRDTTRVNKSGESITFTAIWRNEDGSDDDTLPAYVDGEIEEDKEPVPGVELNEYNIPIYKLIYNGPGACGNDIGHSIDNDTERDDVTSDGRRYIMRFFVKDDFGNPISYGQEFYFSLNPEARLVQGSSVYENLQYVFPDKDDAGNPREFICKPYIMENFDVLKGIISKYCGIEDPLNIDILNCVDKAGNMYDNFVIDETGMSFGSDAIYYLQGGSDGSLQKGFTYIEKVPNEMGGLDEVEHVVTDEEVENTKKSLLKQFFYGQIDPSLFNERLVPCDIVLDANYDFAIVKPAMLGKFRSIRPDIMVIADVGTEARNCSQAINLIKAVYGMVDGSKGYTAAVMAQAGTTTDRALPLHLTGTYDYGFGLAKCYGMFGTFSVFAGYQQARVETMEFDWYPYKDEYNTQIGPLKKLGCIYAEKLFKNPDIYAYMGEENMYVQSTSKLKSIRNGMVIGDAVRLGKEVLIKYVYDNDGALGAIRKATAEMNQRIVGRYPENISVSPIMYQSQRDKLLETSTCDLIYRFPGMPTGWKLNIYAKRAEN